MTATHSEKNIFKEGHNCWRTAEADRLSFLIDADNYFKYLYEAMKQAQRSIIIVGWDFHSRTGLIRDKNTAVEASQIGPILNGLVSDNPGLQVYILIWHFASIYMLERELFLGFKFDWDGNKNIHLHMDETHPTGACQHEKIVVLDDKVAFAGGIDITDERWDTSEHRPHDKKRVNPSGNVYGPRHDVQIALEGEAAKVLGDVARERWRKATGKTPDRPEADRKKIWPGNLVPDMTGVKVAVSRTRPDYNGEPEIREVENLYIDSIKSAEEYVYIENQYFTCNRVASAIEERLQEEKGPEFAVVISQKYDGWLEEVTMRILQKKLLLGLIEKDYYNRFRIYYPAVKKVIENPVKVHSKLMIVDNRFVRVGSSNLTNRSMGVDSECDLAVESTADRDLKNEICIFRSRLIGEHTGSDPEAVFQKTIQTGSLISAIEEFNGARRYLRTLKIDAPDISDGLYDDAPPFDPVEPVDIARMIDHFIPEENKKSPGFQKKLFAAFPLILIAVIALFFMFSFREYFTLSSITDLSVRFSEYPAAPLITVGIYLLASLIFVPVTLMIILTAMVFNPFAGSLYAISGCMLSAAFTYCLGYILGSDRIGKYSGTRVRRVSRRLMDHGILSVLSVRLIPVAPFTLVNAVAGASRINFKDFMTGTLFGMTPGIIMMTVLSTFLEAAIRNPGIKNFALLVIFAGFVIFLIVYLRSRFMKSGQ